MFHYVAVFLCGTVFFPCCYGIILRVLSWKMFHTLRYHDTLVIALRLVSAIQGILAASSGVWIVSSVDDIMIDRHWITNAYAVFGAPYFFYDSWAMFKAFRHSRPEITALASSAAIKKFFSENGLMMCHHLLLPVVYLPIIVLWRRGLGDFFIGCFYLFELAIPFISARSILLQLKMKRTFVYLVNGLLLIFVFLCCRVFLFPYLYWRYSIYQHINIFNVPFRIPLKCNIGCLCLFSMQMYWWIGMVRVAISTAREYASHKKFYLKKISLVRNPFT